MKNILLIACILGIVVAQSKENEMCILQEKDITVFKSLTIFCIDDQKFVSLNDKILVPIKNKSTKEKQCDCETDHGY